MNIVRMSSNAEDREIETDTGCLSLFLVKSLAE